MVKGMIGYLYQGLIVVLNKEDIKNAKDEDFIEVRVLINEDDIRGWAEELEMLEDDEEEFL